MEQCYRNLFEVVKKSHHKYDMALTDTLRKKAYCEIKLLNFEEAGKTLEKIEFILENNLEPTDTEIEEIDNLMSSLIPSPGWKNPPMALISRVWRVSGGKQACRW